MIKYIFKQNISFILIIIISSIFVFQGCGSSINVQSNWMKDELKVDGNASDWENNLQLIKDEKISLGFYNDDKNLYACLVTNDRQKIIQMLRAGFIVWFLPEKDKSTGFGLKYPMPPSLIDKDERRDFNLEIFQHENDGNIISKMIEQKTEIQIVNRDKFPVGQIPSANKEGIKIKIGEEQERFIYEMMVPINSVNDFAYKINAKPGDKIEIVFETMEFDIEKMRGATPGVNSRGGGMNQGGNGSESQRGMRRGQKESARSEPINYSVVVSLQLPQN